MTNIYEFTDYREYLKKYFEERKKNDPKFSHRFLAQRLGLATSNFIMLVMQGKRNLNTTLCLKIPAIFKLSAKEATYFHEMVNFNQAKTNQEKDLYFTRMVALRKNTAINKISEGQYEYYSKWYNPVVRELVTDKEFHGDPNSIARAVLPNITPSQARKSIALLLRLGFIKKQGNEYLQKSPLIETAPEVSSLAVANFHRKMGELGIEALDRIAKTERDITSCTISFSPKKLDEIKKRLYNFRAELLTFADSVVDGQQVYQINFQVFPVSKRRK